MKKAVISLIFAANAILPLLSAGASTRPETWFHIIGEVEFPVEAEDPSVVRSLILPAPSKLNHDWSFEPGVVFEVWSRGRKVIERECPIGTGATMPSANGGAGASSARGRM